MQIDPQTAHWFRHFRNHQRSLWSNGGMITVFPSGRTERTFASAPFGEHAVAAFRAAKRQIHFRGEMLKNA